jgi:hypothetical protein
MLAAPGCWSLYCSLLEWRSSLTDSENGAAAQHLIDAYAAQHATNPERRNRQSVAVHLMSLCAALERGIDGARLRHLIGGWTHREYPLLLPRPASYSVTVADVAATASEDRPAAVVAWAGSTWAAWSAHGDLVRSWLVDALAAGPVSGSRSRAAGRARSGPSR